MHTPSSALSRNRSRSDAPPTEFFREFDDVLETLGVLVQITYDLNRMIVGAHRNLADSQPRSHTLTLWLGGMIDPTQCVRSESTISQPTTNRFASPTGLGLWP